MPTGPRGEKRPPDVIANAVHVAQIATGEAAEVYAKQPQREGERKRRRSVSERRSEKQSEADRHATG